MTWGYASMSSLSDARTRLSERLKAAEAQYADGTFDTFLVFDTLERHEAYLAEHRAAWGEFHEARRKLKEEA